MSILFDLIRDLMTKKKMPSPVQPGACDDKRSDLGQRVFLNVGGGSKHIQVPSHYSGWEHVLLDIDPATDADVVCDARNLEKFEANQYDAIYCSHNLEHYYHHDVRRVLRGFLHVLKEDGFAEIRVPDIGNLLHFMVERNLGLHDIVYQSPAGPIAIHDILWGYGRQIEESGVDFYAHKTGFTSGSILDALTQAGFMEVVMLEPCALFELHLVGFMQTPTADQLDLFGDKTISRHKVDSAN
ncbi:MAG: Methyltransferase domain protein [Betaproteobacteria bacterium ADurb.Bin341]|nr:MAG: Methyltransferase domain protein [Betaproteobacteria bacterium ADurb.Bin341]